MDNNVSTNVPKKASGVSIASLVCAIAGSFINPLYLVTTAAIVLGIVGIATAHGRPKGMAIAGLIIAIASAGIQFVIDCILSIFTMGLSFFV